MRLYEIMKINETKSKMYVGFKISQESSDNIIDFIKVTGIRNPIDTSSLHVTLISSSVDFEWNNAVYKKDPIIIAPAAMFWWIFESKEQKNCLVLRFDNEVLQLRFNDVKISGGKSDFERYLPHVTFSYDSDHTLDSILTLPLPTFNIVLTKEYTERMD